MYKFIITAQLQPGARDVILARAPAVQAATCAEPGCHEPKHLPLLETANAEA